MLVMEILFNFSIVMIEFNFTSERVDFAAVQMNINSPLEHTKPCHASVRVTLLLSHTNDLNWQSSEYIED